ncbi:MAG: type II 3-dehydroquinate dehydratase [Myxococcales bacterium]|nr:type II 3-dehydroquinate dehydratase [Myxococcales bacterium]
MTKDTALNILALHGPNLNLLGTREPEIYGAVPLAAIDAQLASLAKTLGASLQCRQSNHEGELVEWIQNAQATFDGIVINPAAYTHTSLAIADALRAVKLPCIEVHLSNIFARETQRHQSLIAPHVIGCIAGFGANSYALGLRALIEHLNAS